jgi:hypothetical protein
MDYEVIGDNRSNNLQSALDGFGSYLWASSPELFLKMGFKIKQESTKTAISAVYGKNLLIYNKLIKSLVE